MAASVHLPESLVNPQLFMDIAVPVEFPGQIAFDGDWNDFSGPVSFGSITDTGDTVWLTADAQGSWQGIRFDNLQGRYLNGSLTGDLDLAWIDSYRMHGQLTGNELDTGVLIEELDGRATLDVSGELLVPYDDSPLRASLDCVIHKGQLRGHDVAGKLAVDWQDDGLSELEFDLSGKEARLVAKGKPTERLELDLAIADLRSFHPDIAGQLLSSGWLRWSGDYLTGEIDGSGTDIVWQESSFDSLSFQARHLARQAPLEFELDGYGLQYAELQIEHLQAGLSGTLENHDLQVKVNGLTGDLAAQLSGQYRDEVWLAELKELTGQTPILGTWVLEEPANISWQLEGLSLEHFSLVSQRGEQVTLEISQLLASASGRVALVWHDLGHAWSDYLQPSQAISGKSSGDVQLEMAADQLVSLQARLTASVEVQDDLAEVSIPVMTAEVVWREDGLALDVNAESDNGEFLVVTARSSQPLSRQWPPDELSLDMSWQGLKLERLSRFRDELDVQGHSDGNAHLEILNGQLLKANARISADGLMQQQAQPVGFRSLLAELNWDEKSFHCDAQVEGVHDGTLTLNLTSKDIPHLSWPDSGQIELLIDGVDLQSLNPLLPSGTSLDGVIHGKSSGYWQDNGQIFLDGQVGLSESELLWHGDDGQIAVLVERADVEWQWQDDQLNGSLVLLLGEDGELRGSWLLPLPARLPVDFVADGALQVKLQGQMRATGLLAAIAPGLIQDFQGQIKSDLQVTGSWEDPVFSGRMSLTDAGAYLPSTGVTLENLRLRLAMQEDKIRIEEFSVQSGPGTMSGTGELDFDRWQLEEYQMTVEGDRFQLYDFPELKLLCSPKLSLSGGSESVQLRGSVLIPEMSLRGSSTVPKSLPNSDVVISGVVHDERKVLPVNADIQVTVELGGQVWVKTAGVNTRLKGGGTITLDEQNHLATRGEIHLVEGVYKAYGANLDIKQGLLKYKGGQITNPELRIFAARDIGLVQAGVQITGTAEAPVVTLYSRPAMPERDVLSYIFMGRPMRIDQEGEDGLMIGASTLIPGYGNAFSDLGITEIDVQGMFEGDGGVRMRKRLTERWEVRSTFGSENGVDLYYIFKFD